MLSMEAVSAESTIEFTPVRSAADQKIMVESVLTLKSKGSDLQYLTMSLPTGGARTGTWNLESLETEDGQMIAWAGLNASLRYGGISDKSQGQQLSQLRNQDMIPREANQQLSTSNVSTSSSKSSRGESSSSENTVDSVSIEARVDHFSSTQLSVTDQDTAEQEMAVFQESGFTYNIFALLPKPIPAGETTKIKLRWSAEIPFANMRVAETAEGVVVRSAGPSTGLISYLPELMPSPGGTKWSFTTKIGAPSHYSKRREQSIVASGTTQKSWKDDGKWNWTEVRGKSSVRPSVGLGGWKGLREKSSQGMPAVQVNMFPKHFNNAKQFPGEVRRMVSFMEKFLPTFPNREIELVEEQSSAMEQPQSLPGLVKLQRLAVTGIGRTGQKRAGSSHIAQEQIAAQIASQYWGQRFSPNTTRDMWMVSAIPGSYANFYLRNVYGVEDAIEKMDVLRKSIEKPKTIIESWKAADAKRRSLSLSGATPYTDVPLWARQNYGLYVFSEMLRLRVGNQAFLQSLDQMAKSLEGDRISTERVQKTMEKVSKQDLSNFFDFWIHGGNIPRLKVYTRVDKQAGKKVMYGCIESDQPFGIFDVPIRIIQPKKSTDAMIKMVHGYGFFTIPNADSRTKIQIDPLGLILAFERGHKKTNSATPCSQDPKKK